MSFKISAFSSFVYHILLYVLPRIPPSAALLAREASALSTIIPTPTSTPGLLVKRGIPPEDIGSTTVSAYSSWTTWSCSLGSTWYTQAPYGRCRTTASVEIPVWTGCVNTSVAVGPFDVSTCTGTGAQTSCVTGKVHYNHNVTVTNYECWTSWTGGNWEAWRGTAPGPPLAKIIPPVVIIPVVAITVGSALLCLRVRRKRKARMAIVVNGQSIDRSKSVSSSVPPYQIDGLKELDSVKAPTELQDPRRASELSSSIGPFGSIAGTLVADELRNATRNDVSDDASSYHTTNSRVDRMELDGACIPTETAKPTDKRNQFVDWLLSSYRRHI